MATSKAAARYDVEMIRDFLDHLTWELRVEQFEHGAAPGTIHPELGEQLEIYMSRYGCALLPSMHVDGAGLSEEQLEEAMREYREGAKVTTDRDLAALESLRPLFNKALACASQGGLSIETLRPAERSGEE